jgi:aspartate/methionine/tyrosine aminotransferase
MDRLSKIAQLLLRNGSRTLSQKVEKLKKQGQEILHLTSAPLEVPPPHVIEAAVKAVSSSQRSSSRGFPEFRAAIARKVHAENGIICDPEKDILENYGLPMVPGTAFGRPGYLRFCFAGHESELLKALERFQDAVDSF